MLYPVMYFTRLYCKVTSYWNISQMKSNTMVQTVYSKMLFTKHIPTKHVLQSSLCSLPTFGTATSWDLGHLLRLGRTVAQGNRDIPYYLEISVVYAIVRQLKSHHCTLLHKLTFSECCYQQRSSLWSFSIIRFDKKVRFYMNIFKSTHIY